MPFDDFRRGTLEGSPFRSLEKSLEGEESGLGSSRKGDPVSNLLRTGMPTRVTGVLLVETGRLGGGPTRSHRGGDSHVYPTQTLPAGELTTTFFFCILGVMWRRRSHCLCQHFSWSGMVDGPFAPDD